MGKLIALDMPNGQQLVDHIKAVVDSENAFVVIDQRYPQSSKSDLIARLAPAQVITANGATKLRASIDTQPGDLCVVATSASTGQAKGVVLTRDAVVASAKMTGHHLGLDCDRDKIFLCLPLSHIGGLSSLMRALFNNTPFVVSNSITSEQLREASGQGCNIVSLVNTAIPRVMESGIAPWRVVLVGGSAVTRDLGKPFVATYGMTETGSGVVYETKVLNGVSLQVRNESGVCGPNEVGEIYISSPTLGRAYRSVDYPSGHVALTQSGWFASKDMGSINELGHLLVIGRTGDMIISGGLNIWPQPIEETIAKLAGVVDCVVVGVAHPKWGQGVTAVICADKPLTLDEVRDHVKQWHPSYCAPSNVVFLDRIERNALGKINRAKIAESLSPEALGS